MRKSLKQFSVFVLVGLLCMIVSCEMKVEERISEEDVQVIAEKYLEIWNEGNLDLIDALFTPDYVRRYVGIYEDIVGIDAFKKWVIDTRTTYPDFTASIEESFFTSDKIVSMFKVTATNTGPLVTPSGVLPSTGKKIEFRGVTIMQVMDGKITYEWLYFNQVPTFLQLGFTITPPAPPEYEEKK